MRRNNDIEGDGVGGIASMDSEPAHAEHPLQSFHLHLARHVWGRDRHNCRQEDLLFAVVRSACGMSMDGNEKAVAVVLEAGS